MFVGRIRATLGTVTIALLTITANAQADPPLAVTAETDGDRIVVFVDGEEFTAYKFGVEHKYPFFHPVNGPRTGETVTTWDQQPFPHHSSLYISLDYVRSQGVTRGNYWQPRHELGTGQVFSRAPEIVESSGERVVLRDVCDWIVSDAEVHQMRDTRTVTITAPSPDIRILDFVFEFEILEDLTIGPTGHSFFSVRMTPELAVGCMERGPEQAPLGTGTIVNSEGGRDEEGTAYEPRAVWCAYYGQHHGETEGVAIVQHSSNPLFPARWFNRDYGFMSPSQFAWDEVPAEAGTRHTFRYRTIVFAGDHEEAGVAALAEAFDPGL